jgi:hypothetical protein
VFRSRIIFYLTPAAIPFVWIGLLYIELKKKFGFGSSKEYDVALCGSGSGSGNTGYKF